MIDRSGTRASSPFTGVSVEPDDAALLADAADPERWRVSCELLIHRHRELVQRICTRALDGDRAAAEEASQRTFILLNACAIQLRPPVNLPAWLSRVALNSCHRLRREEERRRRHEQHSGSQVALSEGGCEPGAAQSDANLESALAELPAGQRSVIQLHCLDGLSQEEVAGRLGISVTAVRNRLCAARSSLREMLRRSAAPAGTMALLALLPDHLPTQAGLALNRARRMAGRSATSSHTATWFAPSAIAAGCMVFGAWMVWPAADSTAGGRPAPAEVATTVDRPAFQLDAASAAGGAIPGTMRSGTEGAPLFAAEPLPGAWATRHRIAFRVQRVIPGAELFNNHSGMRAVALPDCAPCPRIVPPRPIIEGEHVICLDIRREGHAPAGMGLLFEIRITFDGDELQHGWCSGIDPVWHGRFNGGATSIVSYVVEPLSVGSVESAAK